MPDPVSICNEAIGELGGVFLQAFDEGTSTARLCAQLYPGARDMTLELHPWNWATAYQTLTRSPDAPAMKWAYQYALPTQPWCIKVRGTDRGNGARFEVGTNAQGERVLYSDDASVKIEYTARVDDLGSWSPLALQVLMKLMASKLAKPITGQNSTTQLKWQEALALLPEAKGSDGREGSPFVLRANTTLTNARHGYRGTWGTEAIGDTWRS